MFQPDDLRNILADRGGKFRVGTALGPLMWAFFITCFSSVISCGKKSIFGSDSACELFLTITPWSGGLLGLAFFLFLWVDRYMLRTENFQIQKQLKSPPIEEKDNSPPASSDIGRRNGDKGS